MELFTPEFGLVFWMFVVFVILFAILAKFAWPYIIRSLDERAELIDKGVEYAQEAKAQLDNAQVMPKLFWSKRRNNRWRFCTKLPR